MPQTQDTHTIHDVQADGRDDQRPSTQGYFPGFSLPRDIEGGGCSPADAPQGLCASFTVQRYAVDFQKHIPDLQERLPHRGVREHFKHQASPSAQRLRDHAERIPAARLTGEQAAHVLQL